MAQNRAYDDEAPVEAVVADLAPVSVGPETAEAPTAGELSAADYFVVPATVLNEIVGYLMEKPWRESQHLLRSLDGIRSLDEYLV